MYCVFALSTLLGSCGGGDGDGGGSCGDDGETDFILLCVDDLLVRACALGSPMSMPAPPPACGVRAVCCLVEDSHEGYRALPGFSYTVMASMQVPLRGP